MSECLVCFSPLQFLGAENITEEACSSNSRIEREEKTEGGTRWYRRWTSHGERRPEITAGRGRSSSFRPRPNDGRRPLNGRSRHEYVTTEISLLFYYFSLLRPFKTPLVMRPPAQLTKCRMASPFRWWDKLGARSHSGMQSAERAAFRFAPRRAKAKYSFTLRSVAHLRAMSINCARPRAALLLDVHTTFLFLFFNLLWLRFSLSCRVVVRNKDGN